MPASKDKKITDEYSNNPFTIALKGMNLLFKKATGVAIVLVVLTAFIASTNHTSNATPSTNNDPITTLGSPILDATAIALLITIIVVLAFGFLVLGSIVMGVISYTAAELARGNSVTLKQAAKATFNRLWSFVWLQLLTGIKILLWSLLLIVPGVIMAIRYSLANLSFFDEDKKLTGNAALQDSIALTKGAWMTTFGAQAFFNIITLGVISPIVDASSKTILYRQLTAIKQSDGEVPAPHWLSLASLGLLILVAIAAIASLTYASANYLSSGM